MIKNIRDLIEYLAIDAQDFNNLIDKEEFLIKRHNPAIEKIEQLEKKLGTIPLSFKNFIKQYEFNKVSIGYFDLSPDSSKNNNIIHALIEANLGDPFLPKKFLEENNLIWIGSNNDYTI